MSHVAVIGAGSWGTAFAGLVAQKANEVSLWCRREELAESINQGHQNPGYLKGYELASNVVATSSLEAAVDGAELAVLAVPSTHLRDVCRNLAQHLSPWARVITLTKGVELASGKLMTEVAADELGSPERLFALSGPNHAEEICRGLYSAAVLAGEDIEAAEELRDFVSSPEFRVYVSRDVRGVETCGAVKNVIAIACGMAAGLGLGDNTLALIMTRGIAEIGRVVAATGGDPMTCMGLAGMGDLVATCTSQHSRNRRFGEAFVKGTSLQEFELASHMVVEGAHACVSVRELAQNKDVEVPITQAVWSLVYDGASPQAIAESLANREPTHEFYGMKDK